MLLENRCMIYWKGVHILIKFNVYVQKNTYQGFGFQGQGRNETEHTVNSNPLCSLGWGQPTWKGCMWLPANADRFMTLLRPASLAFWTLTGSQRLCEGMAYDSTLDVGICWRAACMIRPVAMLCVPLADADFASDRTRILQVVWAKSQKLTSASPSELQVQNLLFFAALPASACVVPRSAMVTM